MVNMKLRFAIVVLALFCVAAAQTPSIRLGKLRVSDSITVKPTGRDVFNVFGKPKVTELVRMLQIQTDAVRGFAGGKLVYEITFIRGTDKRPLDKIWVREPGVWGFKGHRQPYGRHDKLLDWLKKAEG
jgi:hypothetical protein